MIRFTIDGAVEGRGYVLIATIETSTGERSVYSGPLDNAEPAALQARALADAAAALIEEVPEFEAAFEALHDALDRLPSGEPA